MAVRMCKQLLILMFFMLMHEKITQADCQKYHQILFEHVTKLQEPIFFKPTDLSDDEKVVQELWSVSAALYNKMVETTALYFTGMLMDSDQFYKQIMFEMGKHFLYASKIIAQYVPKLLHNDKISWRLKLKKSLAIASVLVVTVVWMQKYYKPSLRLSQGVQYRDNNKLHISDYDVSCLDIAMSSSPRQRPI